MNARSLDSDFNDTSLSGNRDDSVQVRLKQRNCSTLHSVIFFFSFFFIFFFIKIKIVYLDQEFLSFFKAHSEWWRRGQHEEFEVNGSYNSYRSSASV